MKKNIFLIFTYLLTIFFISKLQASEDSVYTFKWLDQDKEVYVLQNRTFRKDGKFFISAGGGFATSNPFVKSMNIQARATYFFAEEFGFEVIYSKNNGEENEAAEGVRNNSLGTGSYPFRRIVDNYMAVMIMWSPFYAKINTFNSIVYLDWMIGFGGAKLDETNNKNELIYSGDKSDTKESHSGVAWQTSVMIYLNTSWSMRADLTGIHYRAPMVYDESSDTWYTNYDATVSIGFNF